MNVIEYMHVINSSESRAFLSPGFGSLPKRQRVRIAAYRQLLIANETANIFDKQDVCVAPEVAPLYM